MLKAGTAVNSEGRVAAGGGLFGLIRNNRRRVSACCLLLLEDVFTGELASLYAVYSIVDVLLVRLQDCAFKGSAWRDVIDVVFRKDLP